MISKKVRWALLGIGFIALGGIALLAFDDIEMWYRGKMKRDARAKVEELLTAVMEKAVLPPVNAALASSSLCRGAAGCVLQSDWSHFSPDPKDTRFATTANRMLVLPGKDAAERLELRLQASLENVSTLEFMDNPTLERRKTSLRASLHLYAPEGLIKAARLDPAQRALAGSVGRGFVGAGGGDFDRQVIEPCLKRQSVQTRGDDGLSIQCVLRRDNESMSSYLKRSRGQKPDDPQWYLDIDLRRYYRPARLNGAS